MKRSAHTLVELLLVLGIIAILAALFLGAVVKAKRHSQHKLFQITAYDATAHMEQQLGRFYERQTNFPAFTADELTKRGVFDLHTMAFLNNPEVTFYPFSSADPLDKIILRVEIHTDEISYLVKSNAMYPPPE